MFVRKEDEPAQSRDWDVRATKAIEQARKMPLGHQRKAMRSKKLADCALRPK
jgi:hypothetical protein